MGTLLGQMPVGPAPVVEDVSGLTAWEVCRQLAALPHVLFLDSALESELGRYSFVMGDPFGWVWPPSGFVPHGWTDCALPDPFQCLAEQLGRYRAEAIPELPPFQGGAAGLFAYDLCHYLERLPRPRYYDFPVPDMALGLYDFTVSFDHHQDRAWLICTGFPEVEPGRRQKRAARRRDQICRLLDREPVAPAWPSQLPAPIYAPHFPVPDLPGAFSNFTRAGYLATIHRAIEYVHAGDCFQVNIAQRLLCPTREPSLALYGRLRQCNPAPFAGYFDLGDFVLASASPERFLQVRAGEVATRPIKGTRPRGANREEDQARAAELRQSAKDWSENVMVVDLLRNDLGRVCAYGSIQVEALCRLESYRYVHHLVSEVRGRLRQGLGPTDLLRATFPGGSVTGAPKIRAMEIITELEQVARGPYCGSLGYIGFDGAMDTNLLIRTITMGKGWLQFPVGGGIVADSDPQREYEETWHKAEGLVQAVGIG